MTLIRHKQAIQTRILPHQANRRFVVPSRVKGKGGTPDLMVNGGFDTDTDWNKGAGWTITGGEAVAAGVSFPETLDQSVSATPIVAGETYRIEFDLVWTAGQLTAHVGNGLAGATHITSGHKIDDLVAGGNDTISFEGAVFTGTIDNVTLRRLL